MAERLYMVQKSGLRDSKTLQQLTDAKLFVGEHLHDHQSMGAGKRLERLEKLLIIYHALAPQLGRASVFLLLH